MAELQASRETLSHMGTAIGPEARELLGRQSTFTVGHMNENDPLNLNSETELDEKSDEDYYKE